MMKLLPFLFFPLIGGKRVMVETFEHRLQGAENSTEGDVSSRARNVCVIQEKGSADPLVLRVKLGETCNRHRNCNYYKFMEGGRKSERFAEVNYEHQRNGLTATLLPSKRSRSKAKKSKDDKDDYFSSELLQESIWLRKQDAVLSIDKCVCMLTGATPNRELIRFFSNSKEPCEPRMCWIKYTELLFHDRSVAYDNEQMWNIGCAEGMHGFSTSTSGGETQTDIFVKALSNKAKFKELKRKIGKRVIMPRKSSIATLQEAKDSIQKSIDAQIRAEVILTQMLALAEALERLVTESSNKAAISSKLSQLINFMSEMIIVVNEESSHVETLDILTDTSNDSGFAALRDAVAEDVKKAWQFQDDTEAMLTQRIANLRRALNGNPAKSRTQQIRDYLAKTLSAEDWELAKSIVSAELQIIGSLKYYYQESRRTMTQTLARFH